jgi:hypothetical protein
MLAAFAIDLTLVALITRFVTNCLSWRMGIPARRNYVGQECPTYILEFDNTLLSGMTLAVC